MRRARHLGLILTATLAGGAAGYWAGQREVALSTLPFLRSEPWIAGAATPPAKAGPAAGGPVIYYRDPDGRPTYSATPRKTAYGNDFQPVRVDEDLSFEDKPVAEDSLAPPAATSDAKIPLYYRNPMGLPDTSPVPKKDSMGMDYIPVFAGEDQDGSAIKLSPGKLQRTGVRSEPAAMRVFATPVRASGTVQLDERRQSVIALRFDAYIDKVEDITTGSVVQAGQPLMHVYGPDLLQPAAQYLSAIRSGANAVEVRGALRRLKNFDVPDNVIAEIDADREVPATMTWLAPRSGIVVDREVVDGMKADAGDTLFRLADTSMMWVLADVPESDLPAIAVGQGATVKLRGTNRAFEGKIAVIYPAINKETRTARVRIELPNPDGVLMPDMYADVTIATGSTNPVLAVPASAVLDNGERQTVILDKGEGRLEPREVKLGRRGDGFVEIASGVSAGDRLVTGANFLIDAESNLKAALQGLKEPADNVIGDAK